jgi:hypothetical protein
MITIDAKGADGNAWNIMATVGSVMNQLGKSKEERKEVQERMMSSDYAHLCAVAKEVTCGLVEIINLDSEEDEDEE